MLADVEDQSAAVRKSGSPPEPGSAADRVALKALSAAERSARDRQARPSQAEGKAAVAETATLLATAN